MFRFSLLMLVLALSLFYVAYPSSGLRIPHQRATVQTPGGHDVEYYGLLAMMDVYGYDLKHGQWTSTSIWVSHDGDGSRSSYNSIHVGWQIFPEHYGDSHTHFYTYWTRDGSQKSGCYNMDCPGFVRADGATVVPGAVIDPVGDAHNLQNITIKVFKDKVTDDWWIYYGYNSNLKAVGYYPRTLFTYMDQTANNIAFGAFVAAAATLPTPPMGSGVLPNGGKGRAASFSYVSLVDKDGQSNLVTENWPNNADKGQCYSITPLSSAKAFYGGPGGCV
ncbi:hypothetical protein EJB05_25200, partial [Eragrostis curvula]